MNHSPDRRRPRPQGYGSWGTARRQRWFAEPMENRVGEIRARAEPSLERDVAILAVRADALKAETERCGSTANAIVHLILHPLLDDIRALNEKLNADTSRGNVPADKE